MTNKDGASKQDLPELPQGADFVKVFYDSKPDKSVLYYTADQMHAYARAAQPAPAGGTLGVMIDALKFANKVGSTNEWVSIRRELRDDLIAALSATPAAPEPANHLGNLLAVIHGDGGHYQDEHGTEKAGEDAIAKWHALTSPPAAPAAGGVLTALQMALSCIRWQHFGECRTEGWPGIPPAPADAAKALEAALSAQAPAPEVAPVRAVEQQPVAIVRHVDVPFMEGKRASAFLLDETLPDGTSLYLATPTQATQGGAEPQDSELPEILFDGHAVYSAMNARARARSSVENVSDVLDAVVCLLHGAAAVEPAQAAPAAVVPEAVEYHGLDTAERVCFYEQDFYVLSNFSSFTLQWGGHRFDTSEAAYHWEKFPRSPAIRGAIRMARSAHDAFKVAERNKLNRRDDWDDVKVEIMRDILRAKADQHEYVRRKLLATGDRTLIENSWRDDYWGWGPSRDGQNMLGKLWMEVRAELRLAAKPTGKEQSS